VTGQEFDEATEAGEEDDSVHGELEGGRSCPLVLHDRPFALQRYFHPPDAREP
jgi:hypothetical protein